MKGLTQARSVTPLNFRPRAAGTDAAPLLLSCFVGSAARANAFADVSYEAWSAQRTLHYCTVWAYRVGSTPGP